MGAGREVRGEGSRTSGDDLLLLPVVVVPDGLGVLVPEVVVHDHVQPLDVEVHVPLGVRLVGHLGRGGLDNTGCPSTSRLWTSRCSPCLTTP